MPYELYQQTMKRLSQTLSDKLSIPIHYSDDVCSSEEGGASIVLPLVISRQSAGHFQIDPSVSRESLDEIYQHVQWTLNSLENLFQKYEIPFQSDENHFPIWFSSLEVQKALKVALDVYEKSAFRSFIHLHASVFDSSFFSNDFRQTLIFISDVEQLSRENQLFLSHHLRTNKKAASLIFSSALSLEFVQKGIVPSLMECFTSDTRNNSGHWLNK